jgi:alginate O-acetyltransferase complex protein AlgJ
MTRATLRACVVAATMVIAFWCGSAFGGEAAPAGAGEKRAPTAEAAPKPTTTAPAVEKLAAKLFAECGRRAAAAREADTITVVGRDGWLFLSNELRHVSVGRFWGAAAAKVSRATKAEHADPLPAIVNFSDQLRKAGIELMLVPVPPKVVVYPEAVCEAGEGGPPRLDLHHQAFYKLLAGKGVNVVDLYPLLSAHRADADGAAYCRQDTHWSGRACVMTAKRLAKAIKQRPWYDDAAKVKLDARWRTVEISGDLLRGLEKSKIEKEKLPLRFVGTPSEAGLEPIDGDRQSPVLVLGDSHGLVFQIGGDMHARGAGLASQLAYELQLPIDLLAVRGSGATPARISLYRRAKADRDYLKRKKLIVWCFSAREFTESTGWRPLPIQPK